MAPTNKTKSKAGKNIFRSSLQIDVNNESDGITELNNEENPAEFSRTTKLQFDRIQSAKVTSVKGANKTLKTSNHNFHQPQYKSNYIQTMKH